MPKIPKYQQGSVREQIIQPAYKQGNANASSFGSANFNALQQLNSINSFNRLADTISAQQQAVTAKADSAMVRNSINGTQISMREFSASQAKLEGKDSINLMKPTEAYYNELRQKGLSTMETDAQKEMFITSFNQMANQQFNKTQAQENSNVIKFNEQTKQAEDNLLRGEAIADPSKIQQWQANKAQNIRDTYNAVGKEQTDQVDAIIKVQLGMETENVFLELLKNKDLAGAEYLLQTNAMLSDNKAELSEKLSAAKSETEAETTYQMAFNSGVKLHTLYQGADDTYSDDPKKRDYMKKYYKQQYSIQAEETLNKYYDEAAKGEVTQLTKNKIEQLLPKFNLQLQQEQNGTVKYDIVKEANIVSTITNHVFNPNKIQAQEELVELSELISTSSKSTKEKQTLTKALEKRYSNPKEAERVQGISSQATMALKTYDIKDADKDYFYIEFDKELNKLPKQEQTQENVKKIIDNLMTDEVIDPPGLFNKKAFKKFEFPYLDLSASQKKQSILDNPPAEIKGIKDREFDEDSNTWYRDSGGIVTILSGKNKGKKFKSVAKKQSNAEKVIKGVFYNGII